ncbi:MAG: VanW family protein [Clostridiales bacterium]|nr:VanW family protein [Clostridiales bacterium]
MELDNKGKKKRRKKKTHISILWGALIAAGIIGIAIVVTLSWQPLARAGDAMKTTVVTLPSPTPFDENSPRAQATRIRQSITLLPGIRIAGVDAGGMTREEALLALEPLIAEANTNYALTLQADAATLTLDAEALGRHSDADAVLNEAFLYLKDIENDEELLAAVEETVVSGKSFDLSYSLHEESVRAAVANFALDVGRAPVNATLSMSSGKMVYTDDVPGTGLDADAQAELVEQILRQAEDGPDAIICATLVDVPATITRSMLEGQYVLRAKFSTSFSGSTSDRKFNVRKGADLINGTVLKPGDTFSTNAALGVRTTANGWKMAGAYVQGNTELQAGGGVCQLSSTLYNAVLMADLQIINRRNHSMRVGYVKGGLDATINSVGNIIDFTFKNNTAGDLFIVSYTEGNNVHMELYGLPMDTSEYDEIRLSSTKIKTVSITTLETLDPSMPAGTSVVTREGKQGEVWEAYKEYYKNGKLVKKELINTSNYGMVQALITVGNGATPAPTETPAPTNTPKPPDPTPTPMPTPDPS